MNRIIGILAIFTWTIAIFEISCSKPNMTNINDPYPGVIKTISSGNAMGYDFSSVTTSGNFSIIPTGLYQSQRTDENATGLSADQLTQVGLMLNQFEKTENVKIRQVSYAPEAMPTTQPMIYLLIITER